MYSLLNRVFFSGPLREYVAVDNGVAGAEGRAVAIAGNEHFDITGLENVICLEPLQICIVRKHNLPAKITIAYSISGEHLASVYLAERFRFGTNERYSLYEVGGARFQGLSRLAQFTYYKQIIRGKRRLGFRDYLALSSTYALPRQVILISASCGDFRTIFPMDLCVYDRENRKVLLGLRTTNLLCGFLERENRHVRVSVGLIPAEAREAAYYFAKFHSSAFPGFEKVPYRFRTTAVHRNKVPEFALGCADLEFEQLVAAGSQNVLVFTAPPDFFEGSSQPVLCHQHFFTWHTSRS